MAASEVTMTIRLHRGDLPDLSHYHVAAVAIDTETMGLNPHRDRLCVVQLSSGDGSADVVQIPKGHMNAPNLKALLADPNITKIFHFARFDVAVLFHAFGVMPQPIYCTKIASRLRDRDRSQRPVSVKVVKPVRGLHNAARPDKMALRGPARGGVGLATGRVPNDRSALDLLERPRLPSGQDVERALAEYARSS